MQGGHLGSVYIKLIARTHIAVQHCKLRSIGLMVARTNEELLVMVRPLDFIMGSIRLMVWDR